MTIDFENTSYLEAVQENNNLRSRSEIFNHANKNLKFTYGDVTLQKFNKNYSSDGWFGRKIIAIPKAAWSLAVKTIYHLVKAILVGIIMAISDSGKYFKTHCFCIVRDLQESFGWLISIFNDKFGQYHIQESQFQKSCYECARAEETYSYTPSPIPSPMFSRSVPSTTSFTYLNDYTFDDHYSNLFNLSPELSKPPQMAPRTIPQMAPRTTNSAKKGLKNELQEIRRIYNTEERERRYAQVAEAYLVRGKVKKALEAIRNIYSDTKTKEDFYAKAAESYRVAGELDNALETIRKIYRDDNTKEAFYAKVAESYLAAGDQDKALKTFKYYSYSDTKTKEDFYAKVAESYRVAGELDNALETIKKIYRDDNTKEAFYAKLAESYQEEGKLKEALAIIKKIYNDTQKRESLIVKITQSYIDKGNLDDAYHTIINLSNASPKLIAYLLVIAHTYSTNGDEKKILIPLAKIVNMLFAAKMEVDGNLQIYDDIILNLNTCLEALEFFNNLTILCYTQTKQHFSNNNIQNIINTMVRIVTDPRRIFTFINIGLGGSPYDGFGSADQQTPQAVKDKSQYYKDLGLEPGADAKEINRAFRKLALKYHPDKIIKRAEETDADFEQRKEDAKKEYEKISTANTELTADPTY